MNSPKLNFEFLVKIGNSLPIRWNGEDILIHGHPARYALEREGEHLTIRNLDTPIGKRIDLNRLPLHSLLMGKCATLSGSSGDLLSLTALVKNRPIDQERVPARYSGPPAPVADEAPEDFIFKKNLKKGAAVLASLFLVVFTSHLLEPEIKTDESLIPKKFAKIILTRPKPPTHASSGSLAASRAQAKAVAKAFQTKTVQNSLKSILKSGLSRYSLMSTGKSIQNLSKKIASQQAELGAGVQGKADALLAANTIGTPRVGDAGGYGSGKGPIVNGQGKSQFEVGLGGQDALVDEGLTKEEVARVIHSHMNEIRYCYESGILKDPTIAGKLLIDFRINASGVVPHAGITEASLRDPFVSQCLLSKLKAWKFPHPRGGVMVAVSYPFIFKSLSR